jgi:hypothetical protein
MQTRQRHDSRARQETSLLLNFGSHYKQLLPQAKKQKIQNKDEIKTGEEA